MVKSFSKLIGGIKRNAETKEGIRARFLKEKIFLGSMWLKADFHSHSKEDKKDIISYGAKELIDEAVKQGFEILALTHHNKVFYEKEIWKYAQKKGILLIKGMEAEINKKHVIILGMGEKEAAGIELETMRDLKEIKKQGKTIIAPHPYYGFGSLGKELEENINLFDAIEYCHFYTKWFNRNNKKAIRIAKKYNKPMIGSSDVHLLSHFGKTYSMIKVKKKNEREVIKAIKQGKVKVKTKPLPTYKFLGRFLRSLILHPWELIKQKKDRMKRKRKKEKKK